MDAMKKSSVDANVSTRKSLKRRAKSDIHNYAENFEQTKIRRKRPSLVLQPLKNIDFKTVIKLNPFGFEEEMEDDENALSKKSSSVSVKRPAKIVEHLESGIARKGKDLATTISRELRTRQSISEQMPQLVRKITSNGSSSAKRKSFIIENIEKIRKPIIKLKRVNVTETTADDAEYVQSNSDSSSCSGSVVTTSDSSLSSQSGSENSPVVVIKKRRVDKVVKERAVKQIKLKRQSLKELFSAQNAELSRNSRPKFSAKKNESLEDVFHRLHTSEIPEQLPCREQEFENICNFLKDCMKSNAVSQTMYLSGVPGTGKTVTVLQAVRFLKNSKEYSNFNFVMVNGMEQINPQHVFVDIYQQLNKQTTKIAPKTARSKLNSMFQFSDRKRLPVVLMVDELDMLCTKRQEVVYDIFNWSANEEAKVSVIAIANTLDLPERALTQRISSRLGANRLCFQPYDHLEIGSIIRERLQKSNAVEKEAIEFASRKVAAVSGDLRKALEILRSATQIAIASGKQKLTMKHVQEAVRQASTNVRVEFIKGLSLHSILILRTVLAELLNSGLDELQFNTLLQQYRLRCRIANIDPLSMSSAYRRTIEMCGARILAAERCHGNVVLTRHFRLAVGAHDIQFALKQLDQLEK